MYLYNFEATADDTHTKKKEKNHHVPENRIRNERNEKHTFTI